jgi:tRNA pseudouridine55 synthase
MPNGVLIVDKPRGPTSFDIVAEVRRRFSEKSVGHTGTLDPMATGVLPLCLGRATSLVQFLVDGEKEYQAEALLGVTTDSLDATGQILVERDASHITREAVEAAARKFVGKIAQIPPMHSAIRVDGERLYKKAHRGEEVDRQPREVEVHALTIDSLDGPRLTFTVACGKGTYIRTLAADLGEALGVGGHLTALRRTRVGPFTLADAVPLDRLDAQTPLKSGAEAVAHLPSLRLDPDQRRAVVAGQTRRVAGLPAPTGPRVALYDIENHLVAIARRETPNSPLTLVRVFPESI